MKMFKSKLVTVLIMGLLSIRPMGAVLAESVTDLNSPKYIKWLEQQSMLFNASKLDKLLAVNKTQWQGSYAFPCPLKVLNKSSVWFTAYPSAMIGKDGQSTLQTLGDPDLWQVFQEIGISGMHTGPVKKSGGITGWKYTPSVDGWFDRITYDVDSVFGNEEQYKQMVQTAKSHGGLIIGDVIPGHTGKGADFRLAERAYKNYRSLYAMMEIDSMHWSLLPEVPSGQDSVNLPHQVVSQLVDLGYLPGFLQRVMYSVPGEAPKTGWDATPKIVGVDGKERRWVYLHYFKPGQPTLNWISPTFGANRILAGDLIKTCMVLGADGVRIDSNPFPGFEPRSGTKIMWSEAHPLSIAATNYIAWILRRMDKLSFQELNMSIDVIKKFAALGPDLSYDFVTRPAYQHALLTGDAEFLRLMMHIMQEKEIKPISLIHALQNHDEITYELVHFIDNKDQEFTYHGKKITGGELRKEIAAQMHQLALAPRAPYNALSGNGLCTTNTGLAAAALGIKDPYHMTSQQKEMVKKGHLALTYYVTMQPGVFSISGWDLIGALPVAQDKLQRFLTDGDYRWINRGAYDLLGNDPDATQSKDAVPVADNLYGNLPSQLKDPKSFVSELKHILKVRKDYKIDLAELIAVPSVQNTGVIIMVHRLPDNGGIQATAVNFGQKKAVEQLRMDDIKNKNVTNLMTGKKEGKSTAEGVYGFTLEPWGAQVLLFGS